MRLGRLGICCVKKCSLRSTLCCLTPLFLILVLDFGVFCCFLVFLFSSYQVKLRFRFSGLQKILCLVFSFVCCVLPLPFSFFMHLFFPKTNLGFFSPPNKTPILEFTCWDSLRLLLPILLPFLLPFVRVYGNGFLFQIQFHKGEPAQFRFHSSEFSVSMMHSSLLS